MRSDCPEAIIAGTIAMQAVVTACISLRLYTRRWKRSPVLLSDWLILAAFCCGIGLSVLEIFGRSKLANSSALNANVLPSLGVAIHAFAYPLNLEPGHTPSIPGPLVKTKEV